MCSKEQNPVTHTTTSSPAKVEKNMSQLPLERGSDSTCSDLLLNYEDTDKQPRPRCTCPSCPQHGSPVKSGDGRMEEFMRRSALHMISAARP